MTFVAVYSIVVVADVVVVPQALLTKLFNVL
jgi:hypothetical protein